MLEKSCQVKFLWSETGFSAETGVKAAYLSRLGRRLGLALIVCKDRIMPDFPEFLELALPPAVRHAGLAISQLGTAGNFERGGFALTSPAFRAGEELDPSFTAEEEDAVAPPLEWSAPPPATQELIVIVEEASSNADEPVCHWLVWGLSGQRGKLLEGEIPPRTGKNARGNSEWLLPAPPAGETRHYVFQIFASELPLVLMPGANRAALMAALEGNIIASALLYASFTGSPVDVWAADENID